MFERARSCRAFSSCACCSFCISGGAVAVKKIDTRKVPPEIVEEFCQEADIMRRLRHPSLTLFLGVW